MSSKSAKPNHVDDGDRGYLAFTKASLFKYVSVCCGL